MECDEMIWCAFRNNDQEAFGIMYYRFYKLLLHRGMKICGDPEMVKDCIHDLFVNIWKNKINLSVPASVKGYLIASLRRKIS